MTTKAINKKKRTSVSDKVTTKKPTTTTKEEKNYVETKLPSGSIIRNYK